MGRVLAAVDFSDVTGAVIDAAADLARSGDSDMTLVHVAAGEPAIAGYDKDQVSTFTRDDRAGELLDEHHRLGELAQEQTSAGVPTEPLLLMGDTVERILDEAERQDVSVIVVGSHGHGALHHLLVGSISEGLLRHSPRPVVVVPAPGKHHGKHEGSRHQ